MGHQREGGHERDGARDGRKGGNSRMFDASRVGPSFGRNSAEEALTPPSRYTGVRNGLVNVAMATSLVASEPKKDTLSEEAIRDEVSRILESSMFVQSDRLGRFLR